jgi:hypothetical protein
MRRFTIRGLACGHRPAIGIQHSAIGLHRQPTAEGVQAKTAAARTLVIVAARVVKAEK